MKIAITADLHLTNPEKHPERFHALENILDQMVEQGIRVLIIAGDLFDASCTNPGLFEKAVSQPKYAGIDMYIIPGNHDPVLSEGTFSLPNIKYLTRPQTIPLAGSIPFVFIPYQGGCSMGEVLASGQFSFDGGSWALVGHGDWLSATGRKNAYESGTYMPLSGRDLLLYKPRKVFLGHIHGRMDSLSVHYPGSPCGVDPTETGFRSFLLFDTDTWNTASSMVSTDILFFNETFTIIPLQDEEAYLRSLVDSRIRGWGLSPAHREKVRVRVKVRGYSSDRSRLARVIQEEFKDYQFIDNGQADISEVKVATDATLGQIAGLVKQKIDLEEFHQGPDEPDRDDIILKALHTIYGEKS